jgi:Spy/CpxP family protein refolding chaperone
MKKLLLLISFIGLNQLTMVAQDAPLEPNPKAEEKIQSLEVAYISRKLELTPEEAQKFWPVFNEYKKETRKIHQEHRKNPNGDVLEMEQNLINTRKKYKDQFTGVIGQARTNDFFKAEHQFKAVLLNKIKERRGERPGGDIPKERIFKN